MAWQFDTTAVSHQMIVGAGFPIQILRTGAASVRGASYVDGPFITGFPFMFPYNMGTVMIGPGWNLDSPVLPIPGVIPTCIPVNNSPYALTVMGDAAVFNSLEANVALNAGLIVQAGALVASRGDVWAFCGAHRLSAKKNFDIPHPSKDGWRLRYVCTEAPTADVYFRGRVTSKTEIDLPSYWKDLVDINSITVNLTSVGAHQDVIVKRIDQSKIYLQAKGGMPIDCFYHVYGERIDCEKNIPEYEGLTINDYPGDNDEYNHNSN
jgi:hypothetical protein